MKNYIPLVLAVLLGLAAVLAVGRLLRSRQQAEERSSTVVAAAVDVAAGEVLSPSSIMEKKVPLSAKPAQAIPWHRSETVVGQKALRGISQGDYVLLSDVGLSRSMADIVGEGEWAVTLNVTAGGIAGIVQPGDEVAVIGTFPLETHVATADLAEAPAALKKEATLTLFPKVRVLDVGMGGGRSGEAKYSEIIIALPPRQAQVLIAAQRLGELTLALRRTGDKAAISRLDAGMVDAQSTFEDLLKGLDTVRLPAVPGAVAEKVEK